MCVCFQKNKLIRTLGESLSSCFCGCRWAWAFAPVQVAVGQSFPIFPLAATNKGSCQSKLYRRRFTSIHPRAHTHTLTHIHLHKHTYTSECNYRLNNIQRRCKLVEYLCSAHSERLPTVGRQVRRGIDEREKGRGGV